MDKCELSLSTLAHDLKLEIIYMPESKKNLMIRNTDINRPALQIAGYFNHFDETRIQIFGMVEHDYLMEMNIETRRSNIDKFFSFNFPCLIITRNFDLPEECIELAKSTRYSSADGQAHLCVYKPNYLLYERQARPSDNAARRAC